MPEGGLGWLGPKPYKTRLDMRRIALRQSSSCTVFLSQLLLVLFFVALLACGSGPTGSDDDDGGDDVPPGELALTILFTAMEQARIVQSPASDGAAKLMGLWRTSEGYDRDAEYLILSGGFTWGGQTISTWFKGASMVEVMGAMEYSGQAISSSEFQFGPGELQQRASQAKFPLLSSNIRLKAGGSTPSFATPFVVKDVKGLKVGLIGLTQVGTSQSGIPENTEDFDFLPYVQALNETVPQVKAAGAHLVIVISSLCRPELMEFYPTAKQLGVSMIAGGFCGETFAEVSDNVALVAPSWRFSNYAKVKFRVKKDNKQILEIQADLRSNSGGHVDEEVEAIVDKWDHLAEQELGKVVGYVNADVPNKTPALYNLVMDSWLHAYPADVAQMNSGAVRAGIMAGDITLGTVMGALPFENSLYQLELTGEELVDCLQNSTIVAGMTTRGGYFHSDGTPLKMDSTYHVLTTDFLYGSDSYNYRQYDSTPLPTEILYSEALLTYLEGLATSPDNPLDPFLDHEARR
jgi:2',3'-cyclic-nucleotide 2'-phosphodiesterase (5'-nucleotidase family)